MQVRLDPEFGPDSLLGLGSTGLVLIDQEGSVSLFNRQAARLIGLSPDRALGTSLSKMLPDSHIESWLHASSPPPRRISVQMDGRPLDLDFSTTDVQNGQLRIVTVRDARKRMALEEKANAYEKGLGGEQVDWNFRLKATSLLELLRDFAEDPPNLASVWDMARRTGAILFPLGGAVCVQGNGQFRVQTSWGRLSEVSAFPDAGCLSAPGAPSTACPHFSVGLQGVCVHMEGGRVILARSPESTADPATELLFAETVDYALSNVRA
jgi:PAS domain S-box-containing protein